VSHFDGAELQKGLAERDSTEQHLAVTGVTRPVLVRGTARAAADSVHVLITLGRVLGKVDARAEHAANVRVSLVETARKK
jgi:hypothetical protein